MEKAHGPNGLRYLNLLPSDTPPELREDLAKTTSIIEALTMTLGPFPFDTLGFTVAEDSLAATAISTQTRIAILGLQRLGDRDLAHEIGHQWFGNSLTPATTQDDWLSEGFATYTEALWMEANLGPERRDDLPTVWQGQLGTSTRRLGVVEQADQLADPITYLRGGLTLHALRYEVGDEVFAATLRRYTSEFRHSPVTTGDFITVAEAESGRDLSEFFQAWLYQEPVPRIPGMD